MDGFTINPKDKARMLMAQHKSKKFVISFIDGIRDNLNDSVFSKTRQTQEDIDKYDYFTQVKIEIEKL